MVITTSRLRLRPFTEEDTIEYFNLVYNSKSIRQFVPYAWMDSEEEMYESIKNIYAKGNFRDDFYFVLQEKETGKIIGAIIAVRQKERFLDLSVLVGDFYQHQGFMFEAVTAFKEMLKTTKYIQFSLVIENSNEKSQALAKKLGAIKDRTIINNEGYTKYILPIC